MPWNQCASESKFRFSTADLHLSRPRFVHCTGSHTSLISIVTLVEGMMQCMIQFWYHAEAEGMHAFLSNPYLIRCIVYSRSDWSFVAAVVASTTRFPCPSIDPFVAKLFGRKTRANTRLQTAIRATLEKLVFVSKFVNQFVKTISYNFNFNPPFLPKWVKLQKR